MTGPKSAAVSPDSSAPNSFDVPMKMLFTDETRPRISSGVTSCTIEPRMITLTLSNAPTRHSSASDNENTFDNPNRRVAKPNPVTHQSNALPACFIGADAQSPAPSRTPRLPASPASSRDQPGRNEGSD